MNKFQEYSFLFVAFILGWSSIFGNALSFLLIPLIAINIYKDRPSFSKNLKSERLYIWLPIVFCIYILLLFIIQRYILDYQVKASFKIFERVLLFFFTIPLYILSMKQYINKRLLNRALLLFGGGVLFFNICLFFIQTGSDIFTDPIATINKMYLTRLGLNKFGILGHFKLMLEPQAAIIALALLSTLFMFITKIRALSAILSLGLFLFLSFTLTKSAIGGTLLGGVFLAIYSFKKTSYKHMLWISTSMMAICVLFLIFTPSGIIERFNDTKEEIGEIKEGNIVNGSISPRLVLWKSALNHAGEYALFGKGVYSEEYIQEWYSNLPEVVMHRANTHNSFLEYWILGGLFGLLLILGYFIFPIIYMVRMKEWSLLVLGSLCLIFIASNTCVLFTHSNSLGIIMFWLSAYYLYIREFISLEK